MPFSANILSSDLGELQLSMLDSEVEEGILCVFPLVSSKGMGMGKVDVDMEWLVANIMELLMVVGVSVVEREQVILDFLSSVLCRGLGRGGPRVIMWRMGRIRSNLGEEFLGTAYPGNFGDCPPS